MRMFNSTIPVSPDDAVISYRWLTVAERPASEYRRYIFGDAVKFAASFGMLPTHPRPVVGEQSLGGPCRL
jgi:hypothetical protein